VGELAEEARFPCEREGTTPPIGKNELGTGKEGSKGGKKRNGPLRPRLALGGKSQNFTAETRGKGD